MSDTDDWNDAWWHAQETDERWQRHMQQQAELLTIRKEIERAQGIGNAAEQVPQKRGHR
jgi:hypothetical protein